MANLFGALIRSPFSLWVVWLSRKVRFELLMPKIHLSIGYLASFSSDCKFGKFVTLHQEVSLTNVSIGNYSYVAARTRVTNATIGMFSCIGPEVIIGVGKHPTRDFVSSHPMFYSNMRQGQVTLVERPLFSESSEIIIGNDVWIGSRVIVLDGVTVGDGSIIGAGAVVTRDVPPYAVVAGVPAKLIRYRFEESIISGLMEFGWWNQDIDWLRCHLDLMQDIAKMVVHLRNE